jgi:hypothetical protein
MRTAGTSWGYIEKSPGHYDWSGLDSWVAAAQRHGQDLIYTFFNVPQWAASRPKEKCYSGWVGCAAPPRDAADWDRFVSRVVGRYRGRIRYYELWNEPNASGYWTGTQNELLELVSRAHAIIKRIDPEAILLTPSPSASGKPGEFARWMDEYLTIGGAKYADVIAWHGYTGRSDRPPMPPEVLLEQVQQLRAVMTKHGAGDRPIWNTEGGWGRNAYFPDEQQQASYLARWFLIQFAAGVQRAYWYQWDNQNWGTLWRDPQGLSPAAMAYAEVVRWLDGATRAGPCTQGEGGTWKCEFLRGATRASVLWNLSKEAEYRVSGTPARFRSLAGVEATVRGGSLYVGSLPVLLLEESQPSSARVKTMEAPAQH